MHILTKEKKIKSFFIFPQNIFIFYIICFIYCGYTAINNNAYFTVERTCEWKSSNKWNITFKQLQFCQSKLFIFIVLSLFAPNILFVSNSYIRGTEWLVEW